MTGENIVEFIFPLDLVVLLRCALPLLLLLLFLLLVLLEVVVVVVGTGTYFGVGLFDTRLLIRFALVLLLVVVLDEDGGKEVTFLTMMGVPSFP